MTFLGKMQGVEFIKKCILIVKLSMCNDISSDNKYWDKMHKQK